MLKERQQFQIGVTCAKPYVTKPRQTLNLIAVSAITLKMLNCLLFKPVGIEVINYALVDYNISIKIILKIR